jgi:phosphoribosylanthranilate isomerase
MEPTEKPRIKICCIQNIEEARLAIHYGASALGLVSEMPSGPGVITEEEIAEIIAKVPPPIATFLLTSKLDPQQIIHQQKRCRANTLQLCDYIELDAYPYLREELPGVALVQVIHVTGEEALWKAIEVAPYVNALLLDSGNPNLAIKQLGGTGRQHNWDLSRKIRESVPIPLFLAGGLNPHNVQEAIEQVHPFGLDICSGVRAHGVLDETKLRVFMKKALGGEPCS